MSFVKFKKLNHLSNMPATITNGCIYFVKDVNKIFVDFDSERQAYSISESDVATYTEAAVDESFADLLAKLEAIEATLNPEVKNNYQELLPIIVFSLYLIYYLFLLIIQLIYLILIS